MGFSYQELKDKGDSIELERRDSITTERSHSTYFKHRKCVVRERFRYPNAKQKHSATGTGTATATATPPTTASVAADTHELSPSTWNGRNRYGTSQLERAVDRTSIQLKRLAHEIDNEIAKLKRERNKLMQRYRRPGRSTRNAAIQNTLRTNVHEDKQLGPQIEFTIEKFSSEHKFVCTSPRYAREEETLCRPRMRTIGLQKDTERNQQQQRVEELKAKLRAVSNFSATNIAAMKGKGLLDTAVPADFGAFEYGGNGDGQNKAVSVYHMHGCNQNNCGCHKVCERLNSVDNYNGMVCNKNTYVEKSCLPGSEYNYWRDEYRYDYPGNVVAQPQAICPAPCATYMPYNQLQRQPQQLATCARQCSSCSPRSRVPVPYGRRASDLDTNEFYHRTPSVSPQKKSASSKSKSTKKYTVEVSALRQSDERDLRTKDRRSPQDKANGSNDSKKEAKYASKSQHRSKRENENANSNGRRDSNSRRDLNSRRDSNGRRDSRAEQRRQSQQHQQESQHHQQKQQRQQRPRQQRPRQHSKSNNESSSSTGSLQPYKVRSKEKFLEITFTKEKNRQPCTQQYECVCSSAESLPSNYSLETKRAMKKMRITAYVPCKPPSEPVSETERSKKKRKQRDTDAGKLRSKSETRRHSADDRNDERHKESGEDYIYGERIGDPVYDDSEPPTYYQQLSIPPYSAGVRDVSPRRSYDIMPVPSQPIRDTTPRKDKPRSSVSKRPKRDVSRDGRAKDVGGTKKDRDVKSGDDSGDSARRGFGMSPKKRTVRGQISDDESPPRSDGYKEKPKRKEKGVVATPTKSDEERFTGHPRRSYEKRVSDSPTKSYEKDFTDNRRKRNDDIVPSQATERSEKGLTDRPMNRDERDFVGSPRTSTAKGLASSSPRKSYEKLSAGSPSSERDFTDNFRKKNDENANATKRDGKRFADGTLSREEQGFLSSGRKSYEKGFTDSRIQRDDENVPSKAIKRDGQSFDGTPIKNDGKGGLTGSLKKKDEENISSGATQIDEKGSTRRFRESFKKGSGQRDGESAPDSAGKPLNREEKGAADRDMNREHQRFMGRQNRDEKSAADRPMNRREQGYVGSSISREEQNVAGRPMNREEQGFTDRPMNREEGFTDGSLNRKGHGFTLGSMNTEEQVYTVSPSRSFADEVCESASQRADKNVFGGAAKRDGKQLAGSGGRHTDENRFASNDPARGGSMMAVDKDSAGSVKGDKSATRNRKPFAVGIGGNKSGASLRPPRDTNDMEDVSDMETAEYSAGSRDKAVADNKHAQPGFKVPPEVPAISIEDLGGSSGIDDSARTKSDLITEGAKSKRDSQQRRGEKKSSFPERAKFAITGEMILESTRHSSTTPSDALKSSTGSKQNSAGTERLEKSMANALIKSTTAEGALRGDQYDAGHTAGGSGLTSTMGTSGNSFEPTADPFRYHLSTSGSPKYAISGGPPNDQNETVLSPYPSLESPAIYLHPHGTSLEIACLPPRASECEKVNSTRQPPCHPTAADGYMTASQTCPSLGRPQCNGTIPYEKLGDQYTHSPVRQLSAGPRLAVALQPENAMGNYVPAPQRSPPNVQDSCTQYSTTLAKSQENRCAQCCTSAQTKSRSPKKERRSPIKLSPSASPRADFQSVCDSGSARSDYQAPFDDGVFDCNEQMMEIAAEQLPRHYLLPWQEAQQPETKHKSFCCKDTSQQQAQCMKKQEECQTVYGNMLPWQNQQQQQQQFQQHHLQYRRAERFSATMPAHQEVSEEEEGEEEVCLEFLPDAQYRPRPRSQFVKEQDCQVKDESAPVQLLPTSYVPKARIRCVDNIPVAIPEYTGCPCMLETYVNLVTLYYPEYRHSVARDTQD